MNRISRITIIALLNLFLFAIPPAIAQDDVFPRYPSIEPNIGFWKDIFTRYTSRQAIIHDRDRLDVIYKVVDLRSSTSRRSRRANTKLIRDTKRKYASILIKLSKNQTPSTEEEKRVLSLFGENTSAATFAEAAKNIRFQRGQKDRFLKGLVRSGKYLDRIRTILRAHGLPEDLAYLPHVESSFNYNTYSKVGAAGVWQFTYNTGKRFMKVGYVVDERWDPIFSSEAAAKLLKENFALLKSWPLAITAYNHGARSMARAKSEMGDYERIFKEYDGKRFKFASRNFYSEFLAARDIAKNYSEYFGEVKFDRPDRTITFKVKGYVAIEDLVSHFDVSKRKIKTLNLSLRKPVFEGQKFVPKGFDLRLPSKTSIQNAIESFPSVAYYDKQKRSKFYYVRKGDVASVIARRHGVSLQSLIKANNLDRRARIYAGQNLIIPSVGAVFTTVEAKAEIALSGARDEQAESAPDLVVNGETSDAEIRYINPGVVSGNFLIRKTFKENDLLYGVIEVETGETLGHYADWLNVTAQHIRNLNQLSFRDQIHMNRLLVIPLTKISKEEFEETRYEYRKEFEEDFLSAYTIEGVKHYVVKRGDHIWKICKEKLDLPVWLIKKYNYDIDLNKLMPGQKIIVPIVVEEGEDRLVDELETL